MGIMEILQVAGAIIVSLGGGTALVFGLSSWLGKVWANRILENEKSKHNIELEEYKKKLSEELEKVKAINQKVLFFTKIQYEKEFSIYLELWEAMQNAIICADHLFAADYELNKNEIECAFGGAFQKYASLLDRYKPFYQEDFWCDFEKMRQILSGMYSEKLEGKKYEREVEHERVLLEKKLCCGIRNYLNKLIEL